MKSMKRKSKIISALLAVVMLITCSMGITAKADTCGGLEPEDVYQPSSEEVIQDPILHWAVRSAMNAIKGNVKLTAEVVGDKSVKHITYDLCAHPEDFETEAWKGKQFWVGSLEGIQYAKSATLIDIAYTSAVEGKCLSDLSPLSELTQLQELILKQDGINDISALEGLVNLTWLDVSGNREIEDASAIGNMTKLERLIVSHNKIQNMEKLEGLENLTYLDISYNEISRLPDMSKLRKVYFMDASHNQLTDVSVLSGMKELQTLNLSGNSGITDIRPLANLLKLDKESTVLPDDSKKDDLFAAIEVNKLFSLFNISKMTEADLNNVQNALDAYDALTDEQKTYIDEKRVEAARSNKTKIENGGVAEYYPEYDVNGERQPIWNRLEIKVVDKNGVPLSGVEFIKTSKNANTESSKTVKTDTLGQLILTHTATDAMYDEIVITPAGDVYVAEPASITYSVNWGNSTATVNGNLATGLEELKFMLIPKDEYVDKSELKASLDAAKSVEEAYKYTESSYQNFESALRAAQAALDDAAATKETVTAVTTDLNAAISKLEKTDILTELKLIVKDENGNLFTRPFKFQIRVPYTGAEAWNQISDPYTGVAYLHVSPGWADGKIWEVLACYEEPYEVEPFTVTIGVKDGKRYFKTVNGAAVDVDFEKEVVVKLRADGALDKNNERKPDSTVLKECIKTAKEYQAGNYTPASFAALQTAIENAESVLEKSNVTQNDYNAAVTAIKQAESGLTEPANKAELLKEINMKDSYSEEYYVSTGWVEYQSKLAVAEEVYKDGNATQAEVDEACAALVQSRKALVAKANKIALGEKLEEAKALKAEDYQSGFEALQQTVEAAQAVYDNEAATQDQVNAQVTALENAMSALEKKPAEVEYDCLPSQFRAKVVDESGNPVAGVSFKAWVGETADETIVSDANGVISYLTYGPVQYGKNTYVRLADDRYTTEDEHYFTVTNNHAWASIATVDGQPFADGIKLTYTLKGAGGDVPEPSDKVLSDEKTFRAKVVDEKGNPISGVKFTATSNDEHSGSHEMTSVDGVIEHTIGQNEINVTYSVALDANQDAGEGKTWVCDATHTFKNGGDGMNGAKITEVDGIPLAKAGEITFVLRKSGGGSETEDVNRKELDDQIFFAGTHENKASDYTADSYAVFEAALAEARRVNADKNATQDQVDEAALNLKSAREGLIPVEKPAVCDKYTIRIQVVDEYGNKVTDSVPFTFAFGNYPITQYSSNGVVEYALSTADYGTQTITVSLKDGSVVIGEKEYVVEPLQHEFTIQSGSTDVLISAIDGETLEGTKELKFVLKEKEIIEPSLDYSDLRAAIEFAEGMDQSKYTEDSYALLVKELEKAYQLLDKKDVTQQEINTQTEALNAAVNTLKEKPEPVNSNWKKDNIGWWYRNADGSYPYSCWRKIEGKWYYFNSSGYRVTGWYAIGGAWYFFDVDGIMHANEWIEDTYYLTSSGAMATGWINMDGNWYLLNSSGAKVKGWALSENIWYYMNAATGIMVANEWIDNTYYMMSSGAMATGWLNLDGNWYYLNGNGARVKGWVSSGNTWYYMNMATGIMVANEWIDNTYYMTSNGAMVTGWLNLDGNWYYLSGSGAKVTSQWVGNYYLEEDGIMATSKWVDNGKYYVGEDGAWVPGME